ncbi:MAG: hypothetical protein ACLTSX_12840 [Collinsella sp.]
MTRPSRRPCGDDLFQDRPRRSRRTAKSDTLAPLARWSRTLLRPSKVDAERKTLFDLVKFAYGDHLFGE